METTRNDRLQIIKGIRAALPGVGLAEAVSLYNLYETVDRAVEEYVSGLPATHIRGLLIAHANNTNHAYAAYREFQAHTVTLTAALVNIQNLAAIATGNEGDIPYAKLEKRPSSDNSDPA